MANNFSEVDSAGEIDEAKSEDDSKEDLGHLGEVEDFNNKQIEDYSFEGIKRLWRDLWKKERAIGILLINFD